MKKFLLYSIVMAFAIGLIPSLHAENGDPDANKWKIATISWIKENSNKEYKNIDAKWVVLIGKVTERIDEDTYRLNDGTGNITLDVEDGIELPVGKRVVVRGEIDEAYWDIGKIELNVESWRPESK